jgi:hypothetical protein
MLSGIALIIFAHRCFFQHVVKPGHEANLIVPVPKSHDARLTDYVQERWGMQVVASEHKMSNR